MSADLATKEDKQSKRVFNRDFIILEQGQFFSQIGTQLAMIAQLFWIKHITDSGTLIGTMGMLGTLAVTIMSPFGGTLADRYSRKKIIILCDTLAGILAILLAIFLFSFPDLVWPIVIAMMVLSVIYGVIAGIFNPTLLALIPSIVPKDRLQATLSAHHTVFQLATLLGQAIGGLLFAVLGAPLLLLINGISFLLSAFSESFIREQTFYGPLDDSGNKPKRPPFIAEFKDGIRYIWNKTGFRNIIISFGVINFFAAPFFVLIPFYVEEVLLAGPEWYGYLMGVFGGSAIVGYLLAGVIKIKGKKRANLTIGLIFIEFIALGCIGYIQSIIGAVIAATIVGAFWGFSTIVLSTAIQQHTSEEFRGRVLSINMAITGGLMPLGMVIAGIMLDLTNKNVGVIFMICSIFLVVLSAILFSKKASREFISY